MRNLKKIIAVVVTLVMLFAITSISASAATAPVFSLYGKTETNLTVAAGSGENQEFYELTVYLEDAESQVGAIQGVITYDPAIFTYQAEASELGAALVDDDGYNTVENSLALDEAGTIKFVGVANEAGTWFILRFTVDAIGSASFGLVAEAANATGTAHLDVTAKSLENATITDEAMINMEGGAILQKTPGLTNPKYILSGDPYTGEKKPMNVTIVEPQTGDAIIESINWEKGLIKGITSTPAVTDEVNTVQATVAFNYNTMGNLNKTMYNGNRYMFFYLELPEDTAAGFRVGTNFYLDGTTPKYCTANQYDTFYLLADDSDTWVGKTPTAGDAFNAASGAAYWAAIPAGFKGIVRINLDKQTGVAEEDYLRYTLYQLALSVKIDEGKTFSLSLPWFAEDYTEEYDARALDVPVRAEEPVQDLAFNVNIDSAAVAAAEATYGEVTEIGTLLMYTKRLGNRELKIDMADKTGLVHASKAVAAEDAVESFVTNLNNIKWNGMGVSVSARAYIKFADGTVIYSKNFNNVYETNSGYARESVIGVAVDAVNADEYDAAKAAKYGYNVEAIKTIANQTAISGQDRIDLLNFIADCYKAN